MKKIIFIFVLLISVLCVFTSCDLLTGESPDDKDVIGVEDGYLIVNGVKTEYKVDTPDVIEVVDGYLVVNGVKTEHRVYSEPEISIIDGYIAVNGVKTEYIVTTCKHNWETVTTAPTCNKKGYDTKTCTICGSTIVTNETATVPHTYEKNFSYDMYHHWYACIVCGGTDDMSSHVPDANNNCKWCGVPLTSTPGVIYGISQDGTYAEVLGYNGTQPKVKIASEYEGLPVKVIYGHSFEENQTITDVIIPDTVTSIGDWAFYGCGYLKSIVLPDSVTSIGWCSFSWCGSLKNVVLSENLTVIADSAFNGCGNLSSVVIPDSVTKIGSDAFLNCGSLKSFVLGENVTSIGYRGITGQSSIYTEYEFGTYIQSGDNPYAILVGVTNKNLSSYKIHEDTVIIADGVFGECERLVSIIIPDGVRGISTNAFGRCTNLSSIVIPDSVINIDDDVFSYCPNLKDVYYSGSRADWLKITIGVRNQITGATIHYDYNPE